MNPRDHFNSENGQAQERATPNRDNSNGLPSRIRRRLLGETNHATPVSMMRTIRGLLGAYWVSPEWKTAWALGASIVVLTTALSKASVYIAENTANLMASILQLVPGAEGLEGPGVQESMIMLAAAITMQAAISAFRHTCSTTLHRKWRGWLDRQFNDAVLSNRHFLHLTHHQQIDPDNPDSMPDNIGQRIQESAKAVLGGAIGLPMGLWGVTTSMFFVGQSLMEKSAPIEGLAFLGTYATLALAAGAVLTYVPANTYIAIRLGRLIEKFNLKSQQTEGTYRGEQETYLRSTVQIASAHGEGVQRKIFAKMYKDIDYVWHRQNLVSASFLGFNSLQNMFQNKLLSYLPALPALAQGAMPVKDYLASSELVSHLISDCSWLIHVMPDIANLRTHALRLTGLADAVERVHKAREYYSKHGIAEVNFIPEAERKGLRTANFELYHEGKDKPFLKTGVLEFRPGEATAVMGQSGCGKSTLVKALLAVWPYAKGDVHYYEKSKIMFLGQEPYIPRTSLKQNVCLPVDEDQYSDDLAIADALQKTGLGDFIKDANSEFYNGKPWNQVLSGGQKQLVMLARILLHKPDVLVMDEATSALDEKTKRLFHRLIKQHCPETAIVSIIHDRSLLDPDPETGEFFYDNLIEVKPNRDGLYIAKQKALPHKAARERNLVLYTRPHMKIS